MAEVQDASRASASMARPVVYFVRHGQTSWNAEFRLQGQADIDMTPLGHQQAARNGRRLAELIADVSDFDFVASPLRRTRETMEHIRAELGLQRQGYSLDPRLMEVHFGDWQGFTFAELEKREPGVTRARMFDKWDFLPPGKDAESYEMLLARVRPWFDALTRPTVCVTHGGILRVMFRLIENMSGNEAAAIEISQDHVLRLQDGQLDWL